ncbi:MAG: Ldh family oxidoreductase, partial [bacterium]
RGTGLDSSGAATTDPARIADGGVLLPFGGDGGGHKGSAIAMMVELLAAALIGERFSYEAQAADNNDGGPPRGGEFVLALSPEVIAGPGWADHAEDFFARFDQLPGARLPGRRRHLNREDDGARAINAALVDKIRALLA